MSELLNQNSAPSFLSDHPGTRERIDILRCLVRG